MSETKISLTLSSPVANSLLALLNGDITPDRQASRWVEFWNETRDMPLSTRLMAHRARYYEDAVSRLRKLLDEFFDTGRLPDGREVVKERDVAKAPTVLKELKQFWKLSQPCPDGTLKSHWAGWAEKQRENFAQLEAEWQGRSILQSVVHAEAQRDPVPKDSLLRLAKCRYRNCKKPYHLARRKLKYRYKNGVFCSSSHSVLEMRVTVTEERIEVTKRQRQLLKRHRYEDEAAYRQKLVTAVNAQFRADTRKQITVQWLGAHWEELHRQNGQS